ncbi:MAG: tRNA glutamyl-Q(34) synthetase GluQRS [Cardiobacteriaceae bacterium]|nr:tRNA glutamyl-Q(34) synthetase GluQRS [Cardiobacteriaceae bacterium]
MTATNEYKNTHFARQTTYIGRFAPSPTGSLHFGSLLAATASYLDAKAHQGKWLIRIEDVDTVRCKSEYTREILDALHAHGFHSDKKIRLQSEHFADYRAALIQLLPRLYPCFCSRKTRQNSPKQAIYPRTCLYSPPHALEQDEQKSFIKRKIAEAGMPENIQTQAAALRLFLGDRKISFTDRLYGEISSCAASDFSDPILLRRDGNFAYNLAVVIDDIIQGINSVVRGRDLLDTSATQIAIYEILGIKPPVYLHLPLITDKNKRKLSKQNQAPALDNSKASENLIAVLKCLNQDISGIEDNFPPEKILAIAIKNWNEEKIPKEIEYQLEN